MNWNWSQRRMIQMIQYISLDDTLGEWDAVCGHQHTWHRFNADDFERFAERFECVQWNRWGDCDCVVRKRPGYSQSIDGSNRLRLLFELEICIFSFALSQPNFWLKRCFSNWESQSRVSKRVADGMRMPSAAKIDGIDTSIRTYQCGRFSGCAGYSTHGCLEVCLEVGLQVTSFPSWKVCRPFLILKVC